MHSSNTIILTEHSQRKINHWRHKHIKKHITTEVTQETQTRENMQCVCPLFLLQQLLYLENCNDEGKRPFHSTTFENPSMPKLDCDFRSRPSFLAHCMEPVRIHTTLLCRRIRPGLRKCLAKKIWELNASFPCPLCTSLSALITEHIGCKC